MGDSVRSAASDGIGDVTATVERFRSAFLDRIRDSRLEVPLLPEAAHRVMQATGDENCDARQLGELIRRDAAMAGHVLRVANSALYAPTTPIVSLQQAVSRLGMKKIREIALLIATQTKVFRVPGYDAQVRSTFRHSLAAAAYSQEIARLRRWNVEDAFLAGLMHDAGKPVLWQLLVEVEKQVKIGVEAGLVDDIVEQMHAGVAARLIESWKLPERLAETIAHHHRPREAPSAAQAAMALHLADDLAHFAAGPREVTEEALRSHPMLEPLNLYSDELESLLKRKDSVKAMAETLL
jgi:putative nucleotidyltransferase with HDIG domain